MELRLQVYVVEIAERAGLSGHNISTTVTVIGNQRASTPRARGGTPNVPRETSVAIQVYLLQLFAVVVSDELRLRRRTVFGMQVYPTNSTWKAFRTNRVTIAGDRSRPMVPPCIPSVQIDRMDSSYVNPARPG